MNSNIPHASVLPLFSKSHFIELQLLIREPGCTASAPAADHHRLGQSLSLLLEIPKSC